MENPVSVSKTYTVKRQEEGIRLDNFLFGRLQLEEGGDVEEYSRRNTALRIRCGQVVHNGKKALKPSQKIRMNDVIIFESAPVEARRKRVPRAAIPNPVAIYEDDQVLFIDKPAGLMTHPAHQGDVSLVDWIASHYPQVMQIGDNPLRPGIVHRLDKDTSGVLVIAKTDEAFIELKRMFQERAVEKTYFALTEGRLPQDSGTIDFAITRIPHSEKRSIRRATDDPEARSAVTDYRVFERYADCDLVEVSPKTGRTHQIRVHFSALQHPIVGDRLYGFRRKGSAIKAPRQMLHAGKLSFSLFDKSYDIESELPEDFRTLLSGLTASE